MAPDGAAVKRSPFLLPIPGLVFYTFCRLASLQEGVWVTLVQGFYGRLQLASLIVSVSRIFLHDTPRYDAVSANVIISDQKLHESESGQMVF